MNRQTPIHSPDERPDPDHSTSPDRLLSAYLDGELTAEETQAVETHLENSETARHTLDELRSLSNFLSQLQPESAPQALHNTLLNSPQPTPTTTRTQRRPWIAAAAAALTTVAALVMLALVPQWSPWPTSPTASDESDMAAVDKTPSSSPQLAMSDTATASGDSGAGFGPSATNAPRPPNELLFDSTPDNAEVGQILSAIDTSGDRAVVVRLTVVDIQQGLTSLRLLLQKHEIASVDLPADTARRNAGDGQPADKSLAQGGQLVSVVVQASSEQMSQAMAELRREVVSEMQLAGTLQIATLETAPGGRQALAQLQAFGKGRVAKRRVRSAPTASRPSPDRTTRKLKTRPLAASETRRQPALASAQVRLDLPAELMQRVTMARVEDGKRAAIQSDATRDSKPGQSGSRIKRQVQVVFVLVGTTPKPSPQPTDPDGAA
jgi:hypothetical protein